MVDYKYATKDYVVNKHDMVVVYKYATKDFEDYKSATQDLEDYKYATQDYATSISLPRKIMTGVCQG